MKRVLGISLAAIALSGCVIADVTAVHDTPGAIQRQYTSSTAFYAKSVIIPPGYITIRLPGIIADPLNTGSAAAARFGDTESQTASVLGKIAEALHEAGASEADVVAMTVYLVEPSPSVGMDFDGMMRAYGRRYGSADQPNRPVRSTVQVAALVRPDILVEIEVTAAIPLASR